MKRSIAQIVMIEDDSFVAAALTDLLLEDGHWPHWAPDEKSARGLLARVPEPAAIIVDLHQCKKRRDKLVASLMRTPQIADTPMLVLPWRRAFAVDQILTFIRRAAADAAERPPSKREPRRADPSRLPRSGLIRG